MFKLYFSLLIIALVACNNNSDNKAASSDSSATTTTNGVKSYTWADEDEKEFLAGCVESAKSKLNDTAAFKQCNCVLRELKQHYPSLDSVSTADSTQLVGYADKCK